MASITFEKDRRPDRRKKQRIQLSQPLVGRVGTIGAVLVDLSESGARVEHYTRLKTGSLTRFRFQWEADGVETECIVVSCRVQRFSPGDDGLTVYQSGLLFTQPQGETASVLRRMVSAFVSRALAEQVANARGIGPILAKDMPIFREGVVSSNSFEHTHSEDTRHLIPSKLLAHEKGFIRCRLVRGNWWERKWVRSKEQPSDDGFTVSASEPADQIEKLCEAYRVADAETRRLIRLMAQMSLESKAEHI
ncbi:MAG TPA: PilZ domain-containing protein [Thermoanaerobaculia bacterium]